MDKGLREVSFDYIVYSILKYNRYTID